MLGQSISIAQLQATLLPRHRWQPYPTWEDREAYLSDAYEIAATKHNALGLTPPLAARVSRYHNRPFLVIQADRFAAALRAGIRDPQIIALPPNLGSFDQFVDSTDALRYLDRLRAAYSA